MVQCLLFYSDLKTKISTCCIPFVNIGTSPDRTKQSFSGGMFWLQYVQLKASVELYINKLSDAVLNPSCEKFDSESGELRTPDGLADSCVSSGMAFLKGIERLTNWSSSYTRKETEVSKPTTAASLCFVSQEKCMPRCRENSWTKAGWYPVWFSSWP